MGVIPEFQRRRLASQIVGTPGVDVSQGAVGRVLGGALAGLSEGLFEPLLKQQEAQRKETQKLQDVAEGNRAIRDSVAYINQVKPLMDSHRKQNSPQAKVNEDLNNFRDTFFKEGDSSVYREAFSDRVNKSIIQISEGYAKKIQKQQLRSIADNMTGVAVEAQKMIQDEFADPDSDDFSRAIIMQIAMEKIQEAIEANRGSLGVDALAKFEKETNNALLQAAVNTLMDVAPEEVDAFLDSEEAELLALDGDVSDKDKTEIRKTASDFKAKKLKIAQEIRRQNIFEAEGDMVRRMAAGEQISETERTQALLKEGLPGGISKAFSDRLKDRNKSVKTRLFLGDNVKTFGELQQEMSFLGELGEELFEEGDIKGLRDKDAFAFERITSFRQRVLEAEENGMPKVDVRRWLRLTSPAFNEGMKDMLKHINKMTVPGAWWGTNEVEIFKTEAEKAEALMILTKELYDRVDRRENELKRRIQATELRKIKFEVEKDFKILTSPEFSKFDLGEITVLQRGANKGRKVKIIGHDAAGKNLISYDLDAPVRVPIFEKK